MMATVSDSLWVDEVSWLDFASLNYGTSACEDWTYILNFKGFMAD
jgi:hypothetical protein